jgi:6-pyruvoyltetrahydropterin/6-carboxytetrahydropterin synthase
VYDGGVDDGPVHERKKESGAMSDKASPATKTSARPTINGERAIVARRRLFSSAHFYFQPRFTREQNLEHFGRCYTPHGHGHNYVIEAFVEGPIDSRTGLVMNLADLDQILFKVTDPLDHQHLNFDHAEFKDKVPTTENIALFLKREISNELAATHPGLRLNRLRLFETDDLWVEVS